MRARGPAMQVMAEPVAVTKNELKKRRKRVMQLFNYWRDVFWGGQGEADGRRRQGDSALQLLAGRVLGRTKRG